MVISQNIINAVIGGTLMSVASSMHLLLEGKITGISGSFFGVLFNNNFNYNVSFLTGLLFVSSLVKTFFTGHYGFEPTKAYLSDLSILGFLISGFLVGFGTRLANGCTSGHGVCGLPRLSRRSIVAVLTFCAFGIGFATLRYHYPFLTTDFFSEYIPNFDYQIVFFVAFCCSCGIIGAVAVYYISKKKWDDLRDIFVSFSVGGVFGYGLLISGMLCRHKVINFLTISSNWDITLLFVLGSAVGLNLIFFNLILKNKSSPVWSITYHLPTKKNPDLKMIIGSAIFGIGWGFSGICPGPGIMTSFVYLPETGVFLASMALGQLCGYYSDSFIDKHLGGSNTFKLLNEDPF